MLESRGSGGDPSSSSLQRIEMLAEVSERRKPAPEDGKRQGSGKKKWFDSGTGSLEKPLFSHEGVPLMSVLGQQSFP